MKSKIVSGMAAVVLSVSLAATSAHALLLTPGDADWTSNDNNALPLSEVISLTGISGLTEVYKATPGSGDQGTFASSYFTFFLPLIATDKSGFSINYLEGASITCPNCVLLVKDGNQTPNQYLIDLGSWNGTESITGSGFFPQQGSISHVTIYSTGGTSVPEPATLLLLGTGLAGLGLWRRNSSSV